MTNPPSRLSVIIPAHGADVTLPRVLAALEPQIRPGREVLLVQSGDAAPLESAPWVHLVSSPTRLWPGAARNLGAAQATGELLVFLDADAVPEPDWLDCLEAAVEDDLEAVVGAILNGTPRSAVGTAEYLLTCTETFPGRPRRLRHAPSANFLIRRTAFVAAGGFDAGLRAGEDTVLSFPIAARGALGFAPHAAVSHLNRTRLRPFLANQRRQGAAFAMICRRLPYPNRWVVRGPALAVAGPLRLIALSRFLFRNPAQWRGAIRAVPFLLFGTVAWVIGAAGDRAH